MEPQRIPGAPRVVNVRQNDLTARARAAADAARAHAAAVDAEARFPSEAFAEIRKQRLLGIQVPQVLGGESATIGEIADVCYILGQACSSTGLIYAMHQIKMACITRHTKGNVSLERILGRIAAEQLLMASSTTEGQAGGNVRSSEAPVEHDGKEVTLERKATVISYAVEADGVVTTARRAADAASSDQVLVVFLKDDYTLTKLSGWDAFGMRGTCGEGFALDALGSAEQILPASYDKIHAHTMLPVAHLVWSGVWAGIAAAAVERARAFVRKAHGGSGAMPAGATHLTRASASLRTLRNLINASLQRFEAAASDPAALEAIDFQTAMAMHKVSASELAVVTVMSAMQAAGIAGYRNDSEFSIGRQLRDILSSPIMISNDRIMANVAAATLLGSTPTSLRD